MSKLTDAGLLQRLADGEGRAMDVIFERHRPFVFRVARGLTVEREDAVDIVQEVFLALHQSRASLKLGNTALTTWLYRVAFNKSMDRLRARRSNEIPAEPVRAGSGPEEQLLAHERSELLRQAASELPPRPRQVFVLRVGLGMSVEQTAELTGIEPGAVRTALHTAKSLLQTRLGDRHATTAAS